VSQWFRVRYVEVINSGSEPVTLDGETVPAQGSRVVIDRDYGKRYSYRADLRFRTAGRPWKRIRDFNGHESAVTAITVSPRNKGFATLDATGHIALHYATSHRTLKVLDTELHLQELTFAPRANGLVAMDTSGRQHLWKVDDPHPEAGLKAFFGKVWYEGYSQEKFVWQSTGGSAEFEPKFGLMPLLLGTFKGTLYAMLFSVPLSILAALYVSQLAAPGLRTVVKPVVELMAAIPTVVVGFLAALWLAPRIEKHLAAVFMGNLFVPVGVVLALVCWHLIPKEIRSRAIPGIELVFVLPFLISAVWLGVKLAAPIEHAWFAGDVRQWLFDQFGFSYDQRNCIVVGIGLGYAVIPIIFSISEDALSSVPPSLTSAALALGASPWQTALHVILPAASPGIFAAVMLGLGRAIGETMIVLMATGNTPVMDLSIFNGMRTMSAAIAVEIPEAPHGGTLYRVLFLIGSLLFLITFFINTLADQVSRLLRKRYAQF
jgi:phosphate transport system permease protein